MLLKPAKTCVDIGIVVNNAENSLKFYRDLLGMKKTEELTMALGTIHRLKFGISDIKLLVPKREVPKGPIGLYAQNGIRYITLGISNLEEVISAIKGEGIQFEIPETEIRPGVRIAMVRDPDGNIVEFVERSEQ